jgi:hypothetical protein
VGLIPRASIPVDRRSVALVCGKGLFLPPHTPPAMKTPVCFGGGLCLETTCRRADGRGLDQKNWPQPSVPAQEGGRFCPPHLAPPQVYRKPVIRPCHGHLGSFPHRRPRILLSS